jgi:hypothetical protein
MTTKDALQEIVNHREEMALNWAVEYARFGLGLEEGSQEFRTQLLYVIGNITGWRGELAKQVRGVIKQAILRA